MKNFFRFTLVFLLIYYKKCPKILCFSAKLERFFLYFLLHNILKLFSLEEEIYIFNFFHQPSIKFSQSDFTFAFNISSREFSLVHKLKEEKLIDHLSFTFYPIGKNDLYFGLKNHSLFFYSKIKLTGTGTCKVDKKYSTRGCKLKAVSYDNEEKYLHIMIIYPSNQIEENAFSLTTTFIKLCSNHFIKVPAI